MTIREFEIVKRIINHNPPKMVVIKYTWPKSSKETFKPRAVKIWDPVIIGEQIKSKYGSLAYDGCRIQKIYFFKSKYDK